MQCSCGLLMSRIIYSCCSEYDTPRTTVAQMAHCTILRCQRERELRWLECQREPFRERQCVECRESASSGLPEIQFFSLELFRGSFCFQSFLPSTEHSADFIEMCGEGSIFFGRDTLVFPCKLKKKLYAIKF